MLKERLRFKKEHQQLVCCSSSAAITSCTNHNSSVDTKDSSRLPLTYEKQSVGLFSTNSINLASSDELTFSEKFRNRLTMGRRERRHLHDFAIRQVETDSGSNQDSRVCADMESIIQRKVEEFLTGCVLVRTPGYPCVFTVYPRNRALSLG